MENTLLIHYSEIGTKGKNRSFFERRLKDDIHRRLAPQHIENTRVDSSRILADLTESHNKNVINGVLAQVFGIAWFAYAESTPRDWDDIQTACLRAAETHKARSFKIFCRRADKTYPYSSQDICIRLGKAVQDKLGLKVDLKNHDLAVYIEVLPDRVLFHTQRHGGQRGMPRGTSAKMLCMFSGGIDSPVAAWMLMRRGALVHLLHFHPYRDARELMGSKIFALHKTLRAYNPAMKLYLIPHYPFQVRAAMEIPPAHEGVFFRRFMFQVGETLARRKGMKALITGDCLGQVASQTIENISAAQRGLQIPFFHPLISQDKEDIVRMAQKIGTFEQSIQPYKDCCSLISRHPKTRISWNEMRSSEERIDLAKLIQESLDLLEIWDGEKLFSKAKTEFSDALPL